jgi:hypothetical protein
MKGSALALFGAGVFFGGAVDHATLALLGREETPYGLRCGVAGNWCLAAVDVTIAVAMCALNRRLESPRRE